MAKQVIRYKNRHEWLEARGKGIGASEVGTVLGLNPFETPYQLWRRKKGLDAPKAENFAMKAGHYLEDAVARFYADATGCTIIKNTVEDFTIMDTEKPYLRVSPDRLYWASGARRNDASKSVLECKTTQMEIDAENLPQHWFCQLQMNMGVGEYESGALAWLTMGRQFGYRDISFDSTFYDWMVGEVDRFWTDNMIGNKEPLLSTVDDVLLKNPRHTEGKTVEATQELINDCIELKEIKARLGEMNDRKKEIEDMVKLAMGDAEAVVSGDAKPTILVTWKAAKDGTKFDEKRFASEHPDMYNSYMVKTAGQRRFLIK